MATEFKLPDLGEDVESGIVTRVLVKAGQSVEQEQSVIELETDKATVEVPSDVAGTVKEVRVEEGDEVRSGEVILTVQAEGEEAAPPAEKDEEAVEEEAPPVEEEAEERAEPEPAEAAPAEEEEQEAGAPAGEEVAERIGGEGEEAPTLAVRAAPSVRLFARERGVDISQVPPGPGGRVSREDVLRFLGRREEEPAAAARKKEAAPAVSLPDFERWGPVRREAMGSIRRRTAEHMALCWSQVPHVTQHDLADVTALERARKKLAGRAEEAGARLTLTAVAVKVVAAALRRFPRFNSSLDAEANEIIFKDYCHVGVAVATDRGLLVPVIKDADKKGLLRIARELVELAGKAREGKIGPDELKGGTFTITNVGGIGGTYFTPIVNFPQVAILGIGRAYEEPSSGRLLLPLSLSYDHRVIDGAEGAGFLRWIADALEAPLALLLEQ